MDVAGTSRWTWEPIQGRCPGPQALCKRCQVLLGITDASTCVRTCRHFGQQGEQASVGYGSTGKPPTAYATKQRPRMPPVYGASRQAHTQLKAGAFTIQRHD